MLKFLSYMRIKLEQRIDNCNRRKLRNLNPTLICSNCLGGYLYHWLGLEFQSPFINLFMTPSDFLTALENFDEFINTDIQEITDSGENYPVGQGAYNTKIHFMHYNTFQEAISAWNRRKSRIDKSNMGIILSNYVDGEDILERFEKLPFKYKICFTNKEYKEYKNCIYLKGYHPEKKTLRGMVRNVFTTQYINGKRYIDQFDYIGWINNLKK